MSTFVDFGFYLPFLMFCIDRNPIQEKLQSTFYENYTWFSDYSIMDITCQLPVFSTQRNMNWGRIAVEYGWIISIFSSYLCTKVTQPQNYLPQKHIFGVFFLYGFVCETGLQTCIIMIEFIWIMYISNQRKLLADWLLTYRIKCK